MSKNHIAIVSIPVSDQAASKAFYTDMLGFTVIHDDPMGPDRRWVMLAPEGGGAAITLVTWFDKMPPGSQQGLVLATDDIDEFQADLKNRGVEISDVETQPYGRFAMFQDPDGNGWVLQGTPA